MGPKKDIVLYLSNLSDWEFVIESTKNVIENQAQFIIKASFYDCPSPMVHFFVFVE